MSETDPEERQWSPALRSAVRSIYSRAHRRVEALLRRQAEYLELPDGAEVDQERGVWHVPADGEET